MVSPTEDFATLRGEIAAVERPAGLSAEDCDGWGDALLELHERHGSPYVEARLEAAALWRACGQPERARAVLQEAIETMPRWARARASTTLGVLAHEAGADGDAIAHFYAALHDDPALHEARSNLIRLLLRIYEAGGAPLAGDHALQNIERWQELDPYAAGPRLARVRHSLVTARRLEDEEAREARYEEASLGLAVLVRELRYSSDPSANENEARAWAMQGEILSARGNDIDALKAMKVAAELDPMFASAHLGVGRLAIGMRDYSRAAEAFEAARDTVDPVEERERLRGLAVALRGLRRYDDAKAIYERLLEGPSPDPVDRYNRAHLELYIANAARSSPDVAALGRARDLFDAVVEATAGDPARREVHDKALAERAALDALLRTRTSTAP